MRSARRRSPVLSRMRSRCELTVRTLMCSSAAICALVPPRATKVISSRSRGLRAVQAWCRGRRRPVRSGEHENVLGRGGQAHGLTAFLGRLRLSRAERLPGFVQGFLPLEPALGLIRMQRDREPLAAQRDHRGPYRDGLGGTPGQGAQVPAAVQVLDHSSAYAGPQGGLEGLSQVPGGVRVTVRAQVENHHLLQQVPRLHRSPASRAPASPAAHVRSAAARSPTSISTVVRVWPHTRAVGPCRPADLLRLPGQLHGARAVAADAGDQAEDRQGQRLRHRLITVAGQRKGSAGISGRLGDPAHAEQRRDRPLRHLASSARRPRSPMASRTAVKWRSAPAGSAESIDAWPSQV